MPTITIPVGTRSAPLFAPAGSVVTAQPATGGAIAVEYTTGSAQDVANNLATWIATPNGAYGDRGNVDVAQVDMYLRATATGAAGTLAVSDPLTVAPVSLESPWRSRAVEQAPDLNSAWIAGDSFAQNSWSTTGATFNAINAESIYEWANALCGRPLDIVANVGRGGEVCLGVIATQLPQILAARPGYAFLNIGTNDIYNAANLGGAQTGADTARRIQYIVTALANAGITPIWTTIAPRTSAYSAVRLAEHIDCNNRLRQWAQTARCGIFWDQWAPFLDNTSATCAVKSGLAYDSPALHPNNYGSFVLGRKLAAVLTKYVRPRQVFAFGAEDQTTSAVSGSNVLLNPQFSGTGGTLSGAGVAGTMPDNWVLSWLTRGGTSTATATAAIVDITDSESGVIISRAIQVTITGACDPNDDLQIAQTSGFNAQLSGGNLMRAEGIFSVASPANTVSPRLRVQTNGSEATWWGNILQPSGQVALAQAFTAHAKTRPIAVLGTGAAASARYDFRCLFNGAGTNTVITLYAPRVSRNQP